MVQNILAGILSGAATVEETERNVTNVVNPAPKSVLYDTEYEDLALPTTVQVELSDGTLVLLEVEWSPGDYDPLDDGEYVLQGELQLVGDISNVADIQPTITITVLPETTYDVYATEAGNDTTGNGSEGSPFRTLQRCVQQAITLGGPRTIKLGSGTYTLTQFLTIPANISVDGSGVDVTFIVGNASLNFSANIGTFQWAPDKFLL